MDSNYRNDTIEQADYIEETTGDVFGDDDRTVVVLRVTLALDVPVFDCPNYVTLVTSTKLYFDFIPPSGIWILQQDIEPPSFGLWTFPVP
ncbi:MAG: hypothetical protein IIA03_06800 [Proteobacteria bacterium]|nr:hypothetical protein [Pseudomonadota bacterium]